MPNLMNVKKRHYVAKKSKMCQRPHFFLHTLYFKIFDILNMGAIILPLWLAGAVTLWKEEGHLMNK